MVGARCVLCLVYGVCAVCAIVVWRWWCGVVCGLCVGSVWVVCGLCGVCVVCGLCAMRWSCVVGVWIARVVSVCVRVCLFCARACMVVRERVWACVCVYGVCACVLVCVV